MGIGLSQQVVYLLIMLLGGIGFGIATYIYYKKRKQQTLVCPLYADCEAVIHSQHARSLGVPVELLGMAYYAALVASYGLFLAVPDWAASWFGLLVFLFTVSALLFSVYLTLVQLLAIREWCSWCLTSATLCLVIFGLAVTTISFDMMAILGASERVLLVLQEFGVILAVGSGLVVDLLFFNFLRDKEISHKEREVLQMISQVVWLALGLLMVSSMGLALAQGSELLVTEEFLMMLVVLLVIIANGTLLHFVIRPRLERIFAHLAHPTGIVLLERQVALASVFVSVVSWLAILVLHGGIGATWPLLVLSYLLSLVVAVGLSQVAERIWWRQG